MGFISSDTYVFWDIVDFKVDDEDVVDSFDTDLELTLLKEGYNGKTIISAYGHRERSTLMEMESLQSHIRLYRLTSKFARLNRMLVDMVNFVHMDRKQNFMLIMKGMAEKDVEVVRVIKELQQRDRHVILVVSDIEEYYAYPSEVQSTCTVWVWKDLLNGERPLRSLKDKDGKDDSDDDSDDGSDEGSSPKRPKTSYDAGSAGTRGTSVTLFVPAAGATLTAYYNY